MKRFTLLHSIIATAMILLLGACSYSDMTRDRAAGEGGERVEGEYRSDVTIDPTQSLISHLRRVPGLNISGTGSDYRIQVRGPRSISRMGAESAIFVINNVPVGNSYSDAEGMIYMENVRAITVMRSNEAYRRYGSNGAYGAILIITD